MKTVAKIKGEQQKMAIFITHNKKTERKFMGNWHRVSLCSLSTHELTFPSSQT